MDIEAGRLNLAFRGLYSIPEKDIEKYGEYIKELDLTNNRVQYPFKNNTLKNIPIRINALKELYIYILCSLRQGVQLPD